jgi:hypothetical protein
MGADFGLKTSNAQPNVGSTLNSTNKEYRLNKILNQSFLFLPSHF